MSDGPEQNWRYNSQSHRLEHGPSGAVIDWMGAGSVAGLVDLVSQIERIPPAAPQPMRLNSDDPARWADEDERMAEAIEAGRLVKADCHHGANTYCNHRVREYLTILLDRGLICATPPSPVEENATGGAS